MAETYDTESYNIAFFADTHLGYTAYPYTDEKGINLRVKDGENALHEIINQIVDSPIKIDAVLHGGDIFHYSHPSVRDTTKFLYYTRMLAKRGIPFYGLAGNHDASDNRAKMPAVAVVDDPDRNIHALWKPYEQYQLTDGIILHSVSHHGLSGDAAPAVKAVEGSINIFTTHGAALDPKNATLMNCQDSPREQIIPNEMIVDDSFVVRLLGHYHSRYPVGGELLNTWYSGSTVRRGFSDEPGARGWLLVKVFPDGRIKIDFKDIKQRPQYDLQVIDAANLSAADVQDRIEVNILSTQTDNKAQAFDELHAPIVRQKVINAPRSLRVGVDKKFISSLTRHMMHWDLSYALPEYNIADMAKDAKDDKARASLVRSGVNQASTVDNFKEWSEHSSLLSDLDDKQKIKVKNNAISHLEAVQSQRDK